MHIFFRYSLAVLLIGLLVACDDLNRAGEDNLERNVSIAGTVEASWSANAHYEMRDEVDGPVFLVELTNSANPTETLLLVGRGAPEVKTYRIDAAETEAGAYLALMEEQREAVSYLSDTGTFTIARVAAGSIEGSFSLDATQFFDESHRVSAMGQFLAVPGAIEFGL